MGHKQVWSKSQRFERLQRLILNTPLSQFSSIHKPNLKIKEECKGEKIKALIR